MRALLAVLSGLLAVLLAGAALGGAWANQRVFDRDGFVSLAAPLGGDARLPCSACRCGNGRTRRK